MAGLLSKTGQVADDEAASGAPERFAFRQRANIAQAFGHDTAGGGRNINAAKISNLPDVGGSFANPSHQFLLVQQVCNVFRN